MRSPFTFPHIARRCFGCGAHRSAIEAILAAPKRLCILGPMARHIGQRTFQERPRHRMGRPNGDAIGLIHLAGNFRQEPVSGETYGTGDVDANNGVGRISDAPRRADIGFGSKRPQ